MQIFIKVLQNTHVLEVEPSDTVVSVMQKLRERDVHMAPGRLLMKGKDLTPWVESLVDY